MTATYYVDQAGNQLGGFADGAEPPEGAVEVPAPPTGFHVWRSGGWFMPPTAADVDAERDRRILTGASFTVTGYATAIRLAGDPVTRANLADVAVMAQVQIAAGNGAATLVWRDEDNTDHTLSFAQVLELFGLGFAFFNAVWTAAWPLKDADPIPADYADDSYWP